MAPGAARRVRLAVPPDETRPHHDAFEEALRLKRQAPASRSRAGSGSGQTGAEVGIVTVPALRGRGYATAATAGWASLPALRRRVLFYSALQTNVSSRRVAERLGLRFLGGSLTII